MSEPTHDDTVIEFVAINEVVRRGATRRGVTIVMCVAVIALGGAWALSAGTSTPDVAAGDGLDGELPDTTISVGDDAPTTTVVVDTTLAPVGDLAVVTTTAPDYTTLLPDDGPIDTSTTIAPPGITYPPNYDDTYERICISQGWGAGCTAYIVYDEFGEEVNRVIAGDDYTIQEVSELSGGGPNGTAVPFQHWGPPP